ncbi:MAG: flagellar hook-length control protein FliK, partial [Burkholderiaceae bacterium]
ARTPRAGEARAEAAGLPATAMFADPALAAGAAAAAAAAGTPAAGASRGAHSGGSDARGGRRESGLDAAAAPGSASASGAANVADTLDALRVFAERGANTTERSLEPGAASAGAPTPASLFAPAATALRADARTDTTAPTASYPITVPVQDPRFPDALGERVAWLVREGMQSAELTLHPKELGPIRIDLSIDGGAASIGFSASQADTRGAIEQALPRLREMLADQGLQLGGTLVDAGTGRRERDDPQARSGRGDTRGDGRVPVDTLTDAAAALAGVDASGGPRTGARSGRLDLFA